MLKKKKFGSRDERYRKILMTQGKTQMSAGMPSADNKKKQKTEHLKEARKTFKKVMKLLSRKKPNDEIREERFLVLLRLSRTELMMGKLHSSTDYVEEAQELAVSLYGKNS